MSGSNDPIVGIDLGTTNSVVAAIVDGKPVVLEEDGEKLLPSIVGFNAQGQLITGVVARNQLAAFPDRTIASIKRRMGTMDPVQLGDESFTPPEISAMILRRLKDRASRALGRAVTRAVITVPAFFDESQRQATREAGELAGLTVERIINEPTAATLVYHAGEHDPRRIVVYDFGGGTFDVSIVRMEAGVVEVLTSKGDTHLGGDDLDQVLLDHVADQFLDEHQVDLRENASTRFRLLQSCEQAKRRLSTD
ncbi:MAG: Hsp70 family protein, partial [Aureliella sp.]